MDKVDEILNFWFEGVDDDLIIDAKANPFKKWFLKDPKFDEEIRSRFENDIVKAQQKEYKGWAESPQGRLALILLLDQFTRNIYRNTPKMFKSDLLALDLAVETIKDGFDRQLLMIQRVFVYLPLEHAEDLRLQLRCIELYEQLFKEAKAKKKENIFFYANTLDYAKKHHRIIDRFGRFPHRNAIINRESTEEETEFLQKPGSSF